jgi:hypothetical protein
MGKPLGRLCTAKNEKEKKGKNTNNKIPFKYFFSFLFFSLIPSVFFLSCGRAGCAMRAGSLSRKSLALHS